MTCRVLRSRATPPHCRARSQVRPNHCVTGQSINGDCGRWPCRAKFTVHRVLEPVQGFRDTPVSRCHAPRGPTGEIPFRCRLHELMELALKSTTHANFTRHTEAKNFSQSVAIVLEVWRPHMKCASVRFGPSRHDGRRKVDHHLTLHPSARRFKTELSIGR